MVGISLRWCGQDRPIAGVRRQALYKAMTTRYEDGYPKTGDRLMRDIRSDLEERANVVQEQIRSSHAHFENAVRQLQQERDARIADLSETLAMIKKLMQFESGVMDKVVTLENPQPSLVDRIRAANAG